MDKVRQDIAYALRTMRRNPLATAVIVLTLAIGIGASTAVFTLVDAVLVRKLPYRDPDRLVAVWLQPKSQPDVKMFAPYRDLQALREHAESFEDVAANSWAFAGQTLMWRGEPHRVIAIPSTQNLFALLGAKAARGRTFLADDLSSGCSVVLSNRFWQNQLAGDEDVIGRGITLDGQACSVIGILPAGFEFFPKTTDAWTLITPSGPFAQNPIRGVAIFARLKPGVSREAATAEVEALHEHLGSEMPPGSFVQDTTLAAYDLQGEFTFLAGANLRLALLMLSATVAMVLLICCLNVAGVLLGRGAERQKELALRAALGSDRIRIVRQLLTESIVLAASSACLGALLAEAAVRWFRSVNPIDLPPGSAVTVNGHVLAFTAAAGIAAAVVFGLIPALKVSRVDLNRVLKGAAPSASRRALGGTGAKSLVALEFCLAMVLLTGAGLLIQSIHRLTSAPLSFRTDDLMLATLTLPAEDYGETPQRSRFYDTLLTRVAGLPSVESAALSTRQPLSGQIGGAVTIAGRPPPSNELGDVDSETVSTSFPKVMSLALLRGRTFDARDRPEAAQVAIVNQRFVDEYFPDRDPLGAQVKMGLDTSGNPWLTIVGVVANAERTNYFNEMSFAMQPIVYRPVAQQPERTMTLLVRTKSDVADLGALLQREVKNLDARVPVYSVESMNDVLARTFSQPRLRTRLLGAFAAVAVLLAAIGIYGLLMRGVVQRTREIGIKMALGADDRRLVRSVMGQALALAAIGIGSGLLLSLYLTRFLGSILYGAGGMNVETIAVTSVILIGTTLTATYVPARKAASVEPCVALRAE